jgi:hypothetical protein
MTRPAATPPLRYANELDARKHPLAPEVVALTTAYLEVRFGGAPLTAETRRDFERRVRDIRSFRNPEPEPPRSVAG